MPIVTKHRKNPQEFYYFVEEMYLKNPRGFRTARSHGRGSLTLLEEAGIAAGILEDGYGEFVKKTPLSPPREYAKELMSRLRDNRVDGSPLSPMARQVQQANSRRARERDQKKALERNSRYDPYRSRPSKYKPHIGKKEQVRYAN